MFAANAERKPLRWVSGPTYKLALPNRVSSTEHDEQEEQQARTKVVMMLRHKHSDSKPKSQRAGAAMRPPKTILNFSTAWKLITHRTAGHALTHPKPRNQTTNH